MFCYLIQLNDKTKLKAQWVRGKINEIQENIGFQST